MRGLIAVVMSYGCLAVVAALFFTSSAYAAAADHDPYEGTAALPAALAGGAPTI